MGTQPQSERTFHNKLYAEGGCPGLRWFYSIARQVQIDYDLFLTKTTAGNRVLEYGCGEGGSAYRLAADGNWVVGIDISDEAIRAASLMNDNGSIARFLLMDAQLTGFKAGVFDVVCGRGVLHHLRLDQSLLEVKRILNREGCFIFSEPLGHNPLINLFRWLTPNLRSPDEKPLRVADLHTLEKVFPGVQFKFYCFCTLLGLAFYKLPIFQHVLHILEWVDQALFRWLPPLRFLAWQVLITYDGRRIAAVQPEHYHAAMASSARNPSLTSGQQTGPKPLPELH